MNVPARLGRLNATIPLAELEIHDAGVSIGLRGALRRVSRTRTADFSHIEAVQAVRGALGTRGVRLRVNGEGTWYFWTSTPEPVLLEFAERGVAVLSDCPKLPFLYGKDWE